MEHSELPETGARALVGAMRSAEWPRLRTLYTTVFSLTPDSDPALVEAALDRTRAELAARPDLADEAVGEWRPRMRRLVEAVPSAADRLAEIAGSEPPAQNRQDNRVDGVVHGNTVQTGAVHGDAVLAPKGGSQHNIAYGGQSFGAQHGDVIVHNGPPGQEEAGGGGDAGEESR